jgi:hypothetical protein
MGLESRVENQVLLGVRDSKLQQILPVRRGDVVDVGQPVVRDLLLELSNEDLDVQRCNSLLGCSLVCFERESQGDCAHLHGF